MPERVWLAPSELRVGLGCMRLPAGDDERAVATIAAAAQAGVTVFDTARAYEDNERAPRAWRWARRGARVVTKGGMARPDGAWVPDGRAKTLRADCEASLAALGGREIDLYLLHAPDPRTPWRTSVRALAKLADEGPREARRGVQREPRPARRGARARADRGRAGRAQRPRRPRAARGRRGALRGGGHRGHGPLAARRAPPRRDLAPQPAARGRRRRPRDDPGRGRHRLAARALAGGGRDPRRHAAGDGSLRRGRRIPRARPHRRHRVAAGRRSARPGTATGRSSSSWASRARGRRASRRTS